MKLAVIKTGGKQYLIKEGQILTVEKLDKKEGSSFNFNEVLLYSDGKKTEVGKPLVKGVQVSATVLQQGRARKVTVIKFRHKVRYRRKRGHRQHFTRVKIERIGAGK